GDDLDARVERVEHAGTEAVVHTVTERGPVVLRLPWGERPAVGDDVRLGWAPAHLHAFDRDGRRLAR
ncbi:MAG: TOBE domain-containing protein, partial [Nocardioides sp.]|nr:TOBE domain-containing protein [Nocardioides sp.]